MKRKLLSFLTLFFILLPALVFAQGDFQFKAGKPILKSDHAYLEITGIVGFNHLIYRNEMNFTTEQGRLEVVWPKTKEKKDPFTGENVVVYDEGTHKFAIKFFAKDPSAKDFMVKASYQGCSNLTCFFPTSKTFNLTLDQLPTPVIPGKVQIPPASQLASSPKTGTIESAQKVQTPSGLVDFAATMQSRGLLWVLALALLGGLLVSLTPCVYPMIPITLSIIGGRNENRSFYNGLGLSATYVAGLSLTYALLGLAAATFGAQIRGFLQGTFFQAAISIIFFLLALSMFDVFMLQAPNALRSRLGNIKKSGLFGIFIMGMVSGLMASPCVAAPLAGILAFIASTGNQVLGFFMLLLFAWGMSVPLLVIGAFSGTINSMPKAGEWMNRVKEFYGFLLLGAALYFSRPLIGDSWSELGIALVLAGFAAFLGLFSNLPEDAALSRRVFKSFGVITISIACAFAISATIKCGYLSLPKSLNAKVSAREEVFWQHDLEKALLAGKQSNKPLFLDFRADWCSICRELEENVFPQPEIRMLLEKMIPVKIDATEPDEKTQKILEQFKVIGLPTLVILSPDGKELIELRMVGDITATQISQSMRKALE